MVKRIGGLNRKTRRKTKKDFRRRGKISTTRFMQKLGIGTKVVLELEPAIRTNLYHPRFHKRTATVAGMRGSCCVVSLRDGGKEKKLIIHPVHLRRV